MNWISGTGELGGLGEEGSGTLNGVCGSLIGGGGEDEGGGGLARAAGGGVAAIGGVMSPLCRSPLEDLDVSPGSVVTAAVVTCCEGGCGCGAGGRGSDSSAV